MKDREVQLFCRFYKSDEPEAPYYQNRILSERIRSAKWTTCTFTGKITDDVDSLEIGGIGYGGAQFFFDDFKLEIEAEPGQWRELPLRNAGFEEWIDPHRPLAWRGSFTGVENYEVRPSADQAHRERYALLIASTGYAVRNKRLMDEVFIPARYEYLTKEQGLPGTFINCIYQDRLGMVWVGTYDGLARYDGYEFVTYQNDPADPYSLSANDVSVIFEDRSGDLWIGTNSGGLNLFDRQAEQFRRFQHDPDDSQSLSHNTVTTIYEDREGYIWAGGHHANGLNRLDRKTGHWKQYLASTGDLFGLQSKWILSIAEDKAGRLWIGTYNGGLTYFDRQTERFYQYYSHEDEDYTHEDESNGTRFIFCIYPDRDGFLWLASEKGLYRFDPEQREFVDSYQRLELENSPIRGNNIFTSVIPDSSGALWLCGIGGVSRFDPATKRFFTYREPDRLPNCVMVDREGLVWIGTEKGISRLNPFKNQFQDQTFAILPQELKEITIDGPILEDSHGLLWVRTEDGLYQVDLSSGKHRLFQHNAVDTISLKNIFLSTLREDRRRDIWMGLSGNGLIKWDRAEERFVYIGTRGQKNVRETWSILEDRQDTLWLGTWMGVWQFDRESGTYHGIPWRSGDGEGRTWTRTQVAFEANDGTLWFGTIFGELRSLDRQSRLFEDFTPEDVNVEVQNNKYSVSCIHEDKNGTLWIGTYGKGFYRLDPRTRSYTFFTVKDGLANNNVASILEDDQGRLWLSTFNGLSRFDPRTNRFRNFNTNDGLPSNELGWAHKGGRSGIFYFGSSKGLFAFHPDSIRDNTLAPPVVISGLQRYNRDRKGDFIPVKGAFALPEIKLSYKDDILIFEFAALSYSKAGNNRYAYRLRGLSDEWINLGHKRDITFSDLPPRRYILEVKGSNGDGVWNDGGISLPILITPPWYWSWWTKSLYLSAAAILLFLLYQFQLNRRLAAAETHRLQELDALKTRLYTNITHEFRTPLTVIQGVNEQVRAEAEKLNSATIVDSTYIVSRNSRQLLNLVNQMLDLSKLESGRLSVDLVQGDIVLYLQYLLESFHSLAEAKDIQLHFLSAEEEIFMDYDPEKIQHIVSNLVSNAIKFTSEGGEVFLTVDGGRQTVGSAAHRDSAGIDRKQTANDRHIRIAVRDTGPGIAADKLPHIFDRFYQIDDESTRKAGGTGIGLTLTKELVHLLGGKIEVESEPGKGSVFQVWLPVQRTAPVMEGLPGPEQPSAPMQARQDTNKMKPVADSGELPLVLLVEDNQDVAQYIRSCLEGSYRLDMAHNGREGIDKALELVPDLIVSDVMMPEKDGFELAQMLKNDPRTSHIPIILLTAKADLASRLEGLERGADAYLPKPFYKEELLVRSRKLLELRRTLQAHYLSMAAGGTAPPAPSGSPAEQVENAFVLQVRAIVEAHLTSVDFTVEQLAREVFMSRSQLHRKLTALTGYSANRFVRYIRLSKARELLKDPSLAISSIAYDSGFTDPVYFARVFKQEFGVTPTEYRRGG
ncbi:MAG: helix-turn-helix domain-containing protein [Phaeodactylibacter sp.]|nr:helix-turn-helix domain-containing protein [Phaeodactylibacter sp.]